MAGERKRANTPQVEQAIEKIRAYHAEGAGSLQTMPERGKHGDYAIRNQAARLGWNETKLRKARQFAHARQGYTQQQLEELFCLMREYQAAFGTAHIYHLVTVPRPEREEIQRECVEDNWSPAVLQEEISQRFGPRRQGGRRRRVSRDVGRALAQLAKMVESWRRWVTVAGTDDDLEPPVLDVFPEPVRQHVRAVGDAMQLLGMSLKGALRARRETETRCVGG